MSKKLLINYSLIVVLAIGYQAKVVAQDKPAKEELLLIPGAEIDGTCPAVSRMVGMVKDMRQEGRVDDELVRQLYDLEQFVETGIRDPEERMRYGVEFMKRLDTMTPAQFSEHLAAQQERAHQVLDEIRSLVGPEIWAELRVRHNADAVLNSLRFQTDSKKEFAGLPFSYRSDLLKNILDLRTSQSEAFEELERKTLEDLRALDKERIESFRRIYKSCYNEMLKVLDPRQRKTYKELYGQPMVFTELASKGNWESLARIANSNGYIKQSYRKRMVGGEGNNVGGEADFSGGSSRGGSATMGGGSIPVPEEVDIVLFQMLRDPVIWEEIEATESQKASLKKLAEEIAANADMTNATSQQRLQGLLLGEFDDAGLLGDILLDHQLKWLRQAELQLRLWLDRGSFGLLSSELSNRLGLDAEQKKKIAEIAEKQCAPQIAEANANYVKNYLELVQSLVMEETELLDDEQRNRLARYLDVPMLVTELSKSETSRLERMNSRDLWGAETSSRSAEAEMGLSSGKADRSERE